MRTDPWEGRLARCPYCKTTAPSSPALAFFEYRGPGSHEATEVCRHCRHYRVAHEHNSNRVNPEPGPQTRDHEFEADPKGRPEDGFYCGCRGWD